MNDLRRTPLYPLQAEHGARFVPFAGYEMPVQFSGVVAEHNAVRTAVGLFDVSHMGEFIVEGPEARKGLQYAVTNDVEKLVDGGAQYTVICRQDGGIVDDLIVYQQSPTRFFLVVNASRRTEDFAHFEKVLAKFDCTLSDVSDDWAQLALQGPKALEMLSTLTDVDLDAMKPFSFVDTTVGGVPDVRVARTGYTGEEGVELYCAADAGPALFTALDAAGEAFGMAHCGLGCRDTLRLEMKYALYGNDIDEAHNPYEAGLGWVVKLKKGDFHGRDALASVKEAGPTQKLVGFKMKARGIPRHGYAIRIHGADAGVVTSGTHSPSLGEPIGVGYVPVSHATVGSAVEIVIRDKPVAAEVVKTPFYVLSQEKS